MNVLTSVFWWVFKSALKTSKTNSMLYSLHLLRRIVGPLSAILESSFSLLSSLRQGFGAGFNVELGTGVCFPAGFDACIDSKLASPGLDDSGTDFVSMAGFGS